MSQKFDIIIESAHFHPSGKLDYCRGYERRGPSFSDLQIFRRDQLIKALQKNKKAAIGSRQPRQASTFLISDEVVLSGNKENLVFSTDLNQHEVDYLPDIPLL